MMQKNGMKVVWVALVLSGAICGFAGPKPYEEIYAGRIIWEGDKNFNGMLEEGEHPRLWKKYKSYDENADGVLTVEELKAVPLNYLESGGERALNIFYKRTPTEDLCFDLYYPTAHANAGQYPVIFYAHGGGWGAGSKQGAGQGNLALLFKRLLNEGFAVVSINYRLWKSGGEPHVPECVADCKDAMRYVAKNSKKLKLDPHRFYCIGNSAGGHLSQMMLLTPPNLQLGDPKLADASYTMVAGVSWFGFTNVEEKDLFIKEGRDYGNRDPRAGTISRVLKPGLTEEKKEEVLREMSPTTYVSPKSPPLLILHGDKDTAVNVEHAYFMEKVAKARNAPVEVVIVENAKHGWGSVQGAEMRPSKEEIIEKTVAFFLAHD